ncbi:MULTISPECIES: DUF3953 domain-containing protein [Bacillus]|uniref:DUF3953 domain-containing protein n=1 Tax=Bacillus TaxID=1386 RepID=UPI0002796AF2|nr:MULTISPECIES: DUF3953 domain-containing protein [Bacillus cereus group]EJR10067.1 hypothetical protein II5_00094 [Bacillus cereus MSX-A1]KAB2475293.1 DUF3953 domain-containing protein [Bacillus cereus]MDR4288974.1 DUF3953 domain-containing protein [Bacillus cereus]OUA85660.1 hypothetical protein BK706_24800 [Bacillus thuringiensis serovar leesis]
MLTNLRILLSAIAFILAFFSLFTRISILFSYVFILVSITFILSGVAEIQQKQKSKAIFCFIVGIITFFVGISDILP